MPARLLQSPPSTPEISRESKGPTPSPRVHQKPLHMHPLFGARCRGGSFRSLMTQIPLSITFLLILGKTSVQKNLKNPNLTLEKAEGADEAVAVSSTSCAEHSSPSGTCLLLLLLLSRRRGHWFYQAEVFKRIRTSEKGQEGLVPCSCCASALFVVPW